MEDLGLGDPIGLTGIVPYHNNQVIVDAKVFHQLIVKP